MRYFEVGLAVLSAVLVFSFFGGLVVLDSSTRLVDLLAIDSQRYLHYLFKAFFYLILPLTVGIVFIVIEYKKNRRNLHELSPQWALAIIASIFLIWGALYLSFLYNGYYDAIEYVHNNAPAGEWGIDNLLLTIYVTTSVAGGLFLLAGLLLFYPPLKILHDRLLRP